MADHISCVFVHIIHIGRQYLSGGNEDILGIHRPILSH